MLGKGRHDLGRPGPVTSGSLGLATGGEASRPAPTIGNLMPGGLLANAKATRRLLPDSSAGPTIGTRPDNGSATSAAATTGLSGSLGLRSGTVQPQGTGHVTVNGISKKIGPNGFVPGGTSGSEKAAVPNSFLPGNLGGNGIVRQLPGTAAPLNPVSSATPSTSSHRPAPSTKPVVPPALSATSMGKAPEEAALANSTEGLEGGVRAVAGSPVPSEPDDLDQTTVSQNVQKMVTASRAADSCASELVATGLSGISVHKKPQLEVGELDIGSGSFDPTQSSILSQLVSKLGISQNSTIEEMTGFRGGLNEGVWFLTDNEQSTPPKELVLKLVKCIRISPRILTEAENFVKIYAQHPKIAYDPAVAFPVRIFKCLGSAPEQQHRYDLIVMWKCKGERLAELIAHKWYQKSFDDLWKIFDRLGQCLASFHSRYSECQHGDFQPSNVFYEEDTDDMSLIDIGGMGVPTAETDVEHFGKSLTLLSQLPTYGSQLLLTGQRSLENGYASSKRSASKR